MLFKLIGVLDLFHGATFLWEKSNLKNFAFTAVGPKDKNFGMPISLEWLYDSVPTLRKFLPSSEA